MTRRKFIQKLVKAGSLVVVGVCWVSRKASPRRFVRAPIYRGIKRYPGSLEALRDIHKQGKWSG